MPEVSPGPLSLAVTGPSARVSAIKPVPPLATKGGTQETKQKHLAHLHLMHYALMMRTTLDIDDDVLQAAKELARAEGGTAGQIISRLVRQALTTPSPEDRHGRAGFAEESPMFMDIWPILPNRQGVLVTPELVRSIQDELDLEDGEIKDFTTEGLGSEATGPDVGLPSRHKSSGGKGPPGPKGSR